jgi:hypothetical protein
MAYRITTVLFLGLFLIGSCKEKGDELDCGAISGATFTSNSGEILNLLDTRCNLSGCHATGGFGTTVWTFSTDYNTLSPVFEQMYQAVVVNSIMPPDSASQLTSDEIDLFTCWQDAGFPE